MEYITGSITLQAIFSLHWAAFCLWYKDEIRSAVHENVYKILACRTPQLGYHMYQCPNCMEVRLIPHSCKSRFCSSCGKIATDKWTEERLSDVLPVGYHHLIFTIPWQLRAISILNRKVMLELLFFSASLAIQSWTKETGSYIPGIYIVVHTFGSDIKFNPHLHALVTAGGLSLDHKKWIDAPNNFLMPQSGLKKRWRYNVIKKIIWANNKGLLEMPFLPKKGQYINLHGVVSVIAKLCWYIRIGERLLEIGLTVKYIGRYTKRPVIAEARIISCSNRWVIFKFKDYAQGGKISIKKSGLFIFIRNLIQHIPDKNFRVVRGYGLFSNRLKGKLLPISRKLIKKQLRNKKQPPKSWRERMCEYTGKDPLICEKCSIQMQLIFVCFELNEKLLPRLGIESYEKIPSKQFKLILPDTS